MTLSFSIFLQDISILILNTTNIAFVFKEYNLLNQLDCRNCPDNISVNSHIYQLTAKDEIDRNEPNAYTLRPKANIRGSKNEAIALLEGLKEIILQLISLQ